MYESCIHTKFTHFVLVKAFRFVLHIVSIADSGVMGCHAKRTSALISLRTIVPSIHQVALIDREGIQSLHICLQLLRRYWADWQELLCEQLFHLLENLQ